MPHRPADSRLLSNLLSHEKDYVRSLHSQLDYGQASLSSFSAYAAASPPTASRTIGSVATALVGAHDALRGYALAVEEWCEQLKMLKDMEDEVGMIARDREILVDRLIKASKQNNLKRRSKLSPTSSSQKGASTFSASHSTLEQLSFSNSKLNLAQNELQACETHITEKERMLAQMRESALVGGLKSRCRALVECGLKWSEVGKSGLIALDSSVSRGSFDHTNGLLTQKPLPNLAPYPYQRPSSDISSSLGPSESASQILHPNAISEQYRPGTSSSSAPATHTSMPEADIRDESKFALHLPPAHAISEEDHYTPPQMRQPVPAPVEDEAGGSSLEGDADEQQYEVHENPLFSHPLAANAKSTPSGSKTRLPLRRPKRLNSDSAAIGPTFGGAGSPAAHLSKADARKQSIDPYGTASSANTYTEGYQDSPRTRKRSTFLGLGALSSIFHRKERTEPLPTSRSEQHLPSSPKKGGRWLTRTDKNLKNSRKGDESSDDEGTPQPAVPSYLAHLAAQRTASESRSRPVEKAEGIDRPKRSPSSGNKLRKASDGSTQRKVSGTEDQQKSGTKKPSGDAAKLNATVSQIEGLANGHVSSLGSPSVSRSSTVKSQSTVKTSSSVRPASLDLPPSAAGRRTGGHRRRTSLGNTSVPPTHGQTSLVSIVEDITRQNRQGWLQSNPNSLLVEIKAPKSVYADAISEDTEISPTERARSDAAHALEGRRREPPLRPHLLSDYQRNGISASSSEPSLPLKRSPATPSPTMKVPLRSALRNRSASPSPAALTPPRNESPLRTTVLTNGVTPHTKISADRNDKGAVSPKDSDTASLESAYETGHEDLDSGPPTPQAEKPQPVLPNGFIEETQPNGSHVSASSTGGTATPPSRRKSVRVSLKPTFSPTPPATTDYEEDHAPWAPTTPAKDETAGSNWTTRRSESTGWEDSSEEDEEYSRARQMLAKASRKLEKVYKSRE